MSKPIFVAIDDGNATIDVAFVKEGKIQTMAFPSRAEIGEAGDLLMSNTALRTYTVDDLDSYIIRDSDKSQPTESRSYYYSSLNAVLIQDALIQAGLGGKEVILFTTLPPELAMDKSYKEDVQKKKLKRLQATVPTYKDAGEVAKILEVKVFPEAIAAWFDVVFNDKFEKNDKLISNKIAIVDVGGGTTDVTVMQNYGEVQGKTATIEDSGMITVYSDMKSRIQSRVNISKTTRKDIEDAFKSGKITAHGETYDITEEKRLSQRNVTAKIIAAVEKYLEEIHDLHAVYFVGGGSVALRENLKLRLEQSSINKIAKFHNDPIFANAKGVLKYYECIVK